jgi:hypothetical protein
MPSQGWPPEVDELDMEMLHTAALSAAVLLLAAGCTGEPGATFGTTSWDEVDDNKDQPDEPGEEAPPNENCWGVTGTVDMPNGAAPPQSAGDAMVFLFDAGGISETGFPMPDAEIFDEAGGPASALPLDFQLCFQEGMEGRDIVVVAFLDVDADEELCDDGDFFGAQHSVVDPTDSQEVQIAFETVIWGPDCGRDGEERPEDEKPE